MIKPLAVIAAMIGVAAPAMAQETVFSMASTVSCLADRGGEAGEESCIGASALACMRQAADGEAEILCLKAEHRYWDQRLNANYQELMAQDEIEDAQKASDGVVAPKQADVLRNMQRAWITYRDFRCEYSASDWDDWAIKTDSAAVFGWCNLKVTGQQAQFLQFMLDN